MSNAHCAQEIIMSHGLVISLFLAGLVGGATHCVAMCSPFVLAQIDGKGKGMRKLASSLLLPYHLGRMTTYVVLAVIFNSIISNAFISSDLKALISAPILITAGIIFLVSAFPKLAQLFPWAVNIRINIGYRLIMRFASKLMQNSSVLGRYGLGVLLGLMPCGLVVSALMVASTVPNVYMAALAMAAFAVGTMPALILVAIGGQAVRYKYPKTMGYISRGAMIVSGLWLFTLAGTMVL